MKDRPSQAFSLSSSGARVQFAIGVALIAVIPVLTFWYLQVSRVDAERLYDWQTIVIVGLLALAGSAGFMILRKYPVNIVRLRGYLERMIRGELPDQVNLMTAEDDISAVEKCLNLIVAQLRERLQILQEEKKDLQDQLYQMQKMESLGVMAAGVAHDFNNLLMGIMGNIDLVADRFESASQEKKYLDDAQTLVQQASDLTGQMVVYSGRGQFSMESTNLSKLVVEMSQLLKTTVGKSVTLNTNLAGDVPAVLADPTQMRQVIMNLVLNGSDAMTGKRGTITIATRRCQCNWEDFTNTSVHGKLPPGLCVCLDVVDTGCGMDLDKRARMFDPFFTTKPKGRGLGLAVVLGIVMAHHGVILVDSEVGKGTRFRVIIPVAEG
jgi:signal transduction histidine kinase